MSSGLTGKQRVFVKEYIACLNATEAARRAGYKAKDDGTFRVIGTENLAKPNIRTEIDRLLAEKTMKADEVLARLSDMAEGTIEDFVSINEYTGQPHIDFRKARELGKLHLIKRIKYNKDGFVDSIELHDPQSALVHLGKAYALFTDKVEHSWRETAISEIRAGVIDYEQLALEDESLAAELFAQAGIPVDNDHS